MVSLLVINPAHKLRLLSKLILKGSKRLVKDIGTSTSPLYSPLPAEECKVVKHPKINPRILIKAELVSIPKEGLSLDAEYYRDDSESGLCLFRVENTLFKVHRCYLMREPSAFADMFTLPFIGHLPDTSPIPLFDTADEFRDLLWALYVPPTQLISTTDSPSIRRLLNVAKLANKYCMASYESWALERVLSLVQEPAGFLRTALPETCALALKVALLCGHRELLDAVTLRLVARMLWTDVDCEPILDVAKVHGLRRLQGVAYYKELVTLERNMKSNAADEFSANWPLDADKRLRFLTAHHSLVNLCDWVRINPPTFIDSGCTSHAECLATWNEMWVSAGSAHQTMRCGSADVLGRLKAMMILLRKWTAASPMAIDCTLAALESITVLRDDIVSGLMDHF